jgi:hypothetical protein
MKSHRFARILGNPVLLAFTALSLSGCVSSFKLPEVAGKSFVYSRTDTFGGTTIRAKGVEVTADTVKAESVHWLTQYPQFKIELTVEGYERKRDTKP